MKVRFLTFSKKYNSTLRPDLTQGVEYECVLKTSSDIINPTIELQVGLTSNPSSYNYCYIADYNRYYWVNEWTFANRLWTATLNVDVLATWRPYIGNTDMYVYRASNEYNGEIIDEKYPSTGDIIHNVISIPSVNKAFKDGWFVVGVYGENTNTTSMCYYAFSGTWFANFLKEIYSSVLNPSGWSGLGAGIRNAVFDISSYIKCCYWLPDNPSVPTGEPLSSIKIGTIDVTATCYPILMTTSGYSVKKTSFIDLPKHPQTETRGKFCNLTPYSRYTLIYLPFGVMELDTTKLINADRLLSTIEIDGITGEAILTLIAQKVVGSIYMDVATVLVKKAKYGVDIPITVATNNLVGSLSSAGMGAISRAYGNWISARFGMIGSVANLMLPHPDSATDVRTGILGVDYDKNSLHRQFTMLVDDDIDSNGRPLCKVRKPANLGGYIEGESGTFSAPATITEMEEVKRFIDNGFYFE